MCDTPVGSTLFTLKADSIIHIDGSPYALTKDTVVSGFEEPRWPFVLKTPNEKIHRAVGVGCSAELGFYAERG